MPKSTRINVRFPGEVWQRILAASSLDGVPPTLWVVKACADRLGACKPRSDAIPAERLRDARDTLIGSPRPR
jgi:hypothetical protein